MRSLRMNWISFRAFHVLHRFWYFLLITVFWLDHYQIGVKWPSVGCFLDADCSSHVVLSTPGWKRAFTVKIASAFPAHGAIWKREWRSLSKRQNAVTVEHFSLTCNHTNTEHYKPAHICIFNLTTVTLVDWTATSLAGIWPGTFVVVLVKN